MTPNELQRAFESSDHENYFDDVIVYEEDEREQGWDWDDYSENTWGYCVANGRNAVWLTYDEQDDRWVLKRST